MNLKYSNSIDDISSYARLVYDKSPTVKKHRSRSLNAAVVIIIIMAAVIYFLDSKSYQTLYIWLILAVLWVIYIPFQHKRRYIKNMRKQYGNDQYKNLFGDHSLSFDDNGLTDTKDIGINSTPWEKIEHMEVTDNYTYIFIEQSLAFIIPKESVSEGDYVNFISTMKEKFRTILKGEHQ